MYHQQCLSCHNGDRKIDESEIGGLFCGCGKDPYGHLKGFRTVNLAYFGPDLTDRHDKMCEWCAKEKNCCRSCGATFNVSCEWCGREETENSRNCYWTFLPTCLHRNPENKKEKCEEAGGWVCPECYVEREYRHSYWCPVFESLFESQAIVRGNMKNNPPEK